MADVAQKNVGTAPNMPETMPIAKRRQRCSAINASRSSALA